jgi:hypothetical protein
MDVEVTDGPISFINQCRTLVAVDQRPTILIGGVDHRRIPHIEALNLPDVHRQKPSPILLDSESGVYQLLFR